MGGRGTFAAGKKVAFTYKTVCKIEGIKVLRGVHKEHSLPVEASSSTAYIKLKPDGTFHEMRFYDKNRLAIFEIAYHPEPNLNNGDRKTPILHIHVFKNGELKHRDPRLLTPEEIDKYKKYFKGVKLK